MIERTNFAELLEKSLNAEAIPLKLNQALQGYPDQNGQRVPGLWDDISRGFAENARGDVVTVTPYARSDRIFVQTELPALLNNPNVNTINGLPRQIYVDKLDEIVKALPDGAPMGDAYERLNKNFVQHTSESYMRKFSALEFSRDMGGKDMPRDFLRAHENLKPVLDSAAPPKTSMLQRGFNVASEFIDPIKPGLKTFGYAVVGAVPIIGMLPNTAEAAELKDKLATAIDNGQISPQAVAEYNIIMAGHIAQGLDPTVILGEAGIQQSFNDWADRYDVQGELRESLQPTSLALMLKDGGIYIAENIERLPSATVDVGRYAGQTVMEAGELSLNTINKAYDYMNGKTDQIQELYDALPSVDLQEVTARNLTGDHAPLNEREDILPLLEAKARAEYFEDHMSITEDPDRQAYYGERLQDARDDFNTSAMAMDEGQLNDVKDYLATYNQYRQGVAAENALAVQAQGFRTNPELVGSQSGPAQNRLAM
ncbi:MAG: hypothetical protein OEY94_02250 [Alphaproteobacteria bacterium]|nr:hypothetical protein [Alphaproteobacteria bacterium]